jgi:hypothetical protein
MIMACAIALKTLVLFELGTQAIPLVGVDVRASLLDFLAEVTVEQRYRRVLLFGHLNDLVLYTLVVPE